jgi:very-short-patch-repair endonuclease
MSKHPSLQQQHARELRRNSTDAEKWLWQRLRNRQLLGHKFRRQVPIGPYIVDFICLERRLLIEVDGSQHRQQEDYDEGRSQFLAMQGCRVLRYWNNEVLQQGEAVLESILQALLAPHPNPSPRRGEGLDTALPTALPAIPAVESEGQDT